jgi:recombination protein RecR
MAALPPSLEALVAAFARLPGIGRKTALRLAMHSLGSGREGAGQLARSLDAALGGCRPCRRCGHLCEGEDLCSVCRNPARDAGLVCVVESLADLLAVERSGEYRGIYHVLGGALSPLDGIGPGELRIAGLERRLEEEPIRELLLATSSTVEGDATALYLQRLFRGRVQLSRLARGVPSGGQLDYVDDLTLARAIDGRETLD